MDELRVVVNWTPVQGSWLLIDDIYLLREPPPAALGYRVDEWPTLAQVADLLGQRLPTHVQYEIEDVLVVFPRCYAARLP